MKKYFKLFSVLLVVFLLTGCAKYNVKMNIGKDGKVSLDIISAMESSYKSYGDLEGEKKALEAKGLASKEYKDDTYEGYEYTKTYKSIDKISSKDSVTVVLDDLKDEKKEEPKAWFQVKKGLFSNKYIAKFTFGSSAEGETMSGSTTSMDLKYEVTLPSKAGKNNATEKSKDGKTLTWKLEYGKVNEINYEFTKVNTIGYVIIVVVVLAVVCAVVMVVKNSKGKKGAAPVAEVKPEEPKAE